MPCTILAALNKTDKTPPPLWELTVKLREAAKTNINKQNTRHVIRAARYGEKRREKKAEKQQDKGTAVAILNKKVPTRR